MGNPENMQIVFVIINLLKVIVPIALLIVVGIVLAASKRKRRERMNEQLHQLFNPQDGNGQNGNGPGGTPLS